MINVTFSGDKGCATIDDKYRAQAAAEEYLEARGVSAEEAFAAYVRDIESCGNLESELASIWAEAEYAAQVAGTDGWAVTDNVIVSISAS